MSSASTPREGSPLPTKRRKLAHDDQPAENTVNVVLSTRHDLSNRPSLSISRAPILVPISEGSEYHNTDQLASNRIGFRYTHAGILPPGAAIPLRTIESNPPNFRVSWEDRSPFLKVTADGLGILGDKGFRSARCNAPIREGDWYMEVKIENGGGNLAESNNRDGAHVRLGWARREAPLNAPVGLDGYSYGIRDKTGEKVTLSRLKPYGKPFSSGDVVGMYISLPPKRIPKQNDIHDPARMKRERIAIDFKGQEYFESLEYPASKEMIQLMDYFSKPSGSTTSLPSSKKSATVKNLPERRRGNKSEPQAAPLRPLPVLPGSQIAFFINGECQGVAYQNIYDYLQLRAPESARKTKEKKRTREGNREHRENPFDDGTLGYYPFISLFNGARVRINPGPDFAYAPPPDIGAHLAGDSSHKDQRTWRPICERYPEFMAEQWSLDAEEERLAQIDLAKRAEEERIEAEKKAQREKKKAQNEARKRAKKVALEDLKKDTFIPALGEDLSSHTQNHPSPLRHGIVYSPEEIPNNSRAHSPAASSVAANEVQSGYNSETQEEEAVQDDKDPMQFEETQ